MNAARFAASLSVLALGIALAAEPALAQEPGLAGRSDVVLQDGFETDDWYTAWGLSSAPRNTSVVRGDAFRGDAVVRIDVPAGDHYGTSWGYDFADRGHGDVDEAYFRYALRLGPTWTTEGGGGGKLPGFGATYDTAGWGGRPANGTNGWSSRGLFWQPESGRATGATRVGYYVYHADMTGTYGDNWFWSGDALAPNDALEVNRWYQIEAYVRNNTPGDNDGILRAWVDGEQVFERTDVRFRDVERLHLERVWMDVYYGGSWSAPRDMYLEIDNVVIAWSYIGPVSDTAPGSDAGVPGSDAGVSPGSDGGPSTRTDAGASPGADGGSATRDAGPGSGPGADSTTMDGGCACATSGGGHAPLLPALALLTLLLSRRKRRS